MFSGPHGSCVGVDGKRIGGNAEVRLMTQHGYPLEYTIAGVATGEAINAEDGPEDQDVEADDVAYICEGQQLGYGSKRAWRVARR